MRRERRAVLECVAVTRSVVLLPEVRQRWSDASALEGWSIGALVGHLVRGISIILTYLDAEVAPEADVMTPAEYWRRVPPDLDDPQHAAITDRARTQAERGLDALLAGLDEAQPRLEAAFESVAEGRLVAVFAGHVLTFDDYLVCRCVELTIHTDDLCVSLGIGTPALLPNALALSIDALVGAGRLRHGDLAVLRALTRRERDGIRALRVL